MTAVEFQRLFAARVPPLDIKKVGRMLSQGRMLVPNEVLVFKCDARTAISTLRLLSCGAGWQEDTARPKFAKVAAVEAPRVVDWRKRGKVRRVHCGRTPTVATTAAVATAG